MTYAALQRSTIDIVTIELANRHGSIFMRVHFDERKSAIGLQAGLENVTKVLEQRHQVVLRGVRCKVADVARGLPLGSLLDDHVVALDTVGWEMVVTKGCGRGHAHSRHRLLLGNGRLALLVSPVAANGTRTKPFAIHGGQGLVRITTVTESNEAIATRTSRLHIPHHTGFRNRTESRESLRQDLIVDFVAQVTDEDVEVVRGIFLVCAVGLIGPVDTNFLRR